MPGMVCVTIYLSERRRRPTGTTTYSPLYYADQVSSIRTCPEVLLRLTDDVRRKPLTAVWSVALTLPTTTPLALTTEQS